jgi:hypothetical protein
MEVNNHDWRQTLGARPKASRKRIWRKMW